MQKKFVLGILVLVLIFSVIFSRFSAANLDDKGYSQEPLGFLEPTQHETEQTEPEQTENQSTSEQKQTKPKPVSKPEPELNENETMPEPETTETEHTHESEPVPETKPTEPEPADPEPTQTNPRPPPPLVQTNYSEPVMDAINFIITQPEPEATLWLDVMHRRFEITEFSNSLENFDYLLYLFPDKEYVRLFRRIADYNTRINESDLKKVTNELDLITLPALYCDRLELPINYTARLEEGISQGGYQLTHVLLAWIWLQENGAHLELELSETLIDYMYQANSELINTDSTVTDLELEAAAFLCLAGQSELIDGSFVDLVYASQAADGSWGETNKSWHTTVLGLLFLLHTDFPSDSYPPVLAPNSD